MASPVPGVQGSMLCGNAGCSFSTGGDSEFATHRGCDCSLFSADMLLITGIRSEQSVLVLVAEIAAAVSGRACKRKDMLSAVDSGRAC